MNEMPGYFVLGDNMLTKLNFDDYQRRAINFQVQTPRSFLWLFMGAGKTSCTLTSIAHLINHGTIRAALVIGPLRVIQSVWEQESRKWQHLNHLRFINLHGTREEIIGGLHMKADVYLINYEGLEKLSAACQHYFSGKGMLLPFDMLVIDESSKVKNPETVRVQSLLPILPYCHYRTGLTGSPSPNGLIDLFGQFLVVDDGARLGTSYDGYKNAYFKSGGFGGYTYEATEQSKDIIYRAVADITLEMAQDDYVKLPDFIVNDIRVDLPPRARQQYVQMENLFWAELEDGGIIEVNSPIASINKLLQISNGAIYTNTETREWSKCHDAKLDAVEDILEEAAGNPVLLGYSFRSDAERIKKRFKFARDLTGMTGNEFNQAIYDFQQGRIRMLIGHPASMGHGVDGLQNNCSRLIWYGLPWSLEHYIQFNARVHRRGKTDEPVKCYRVISNDTMDEAVSLKLAMKDDTQRALREAVGAYRDKISHKLLTNVA